MAFLARNGGGSLPLTDNLVHRVGVVKYEEGEASLLAGVLVGDDVDGLDVAVLGEVVSEQVLVHVVLDPSDKHLLDGGVRLRLIGLLRRNGDGSKL